MPGPPVHVHPNSEESFDVLEGELEFLVDGKWSTVGAGGSVTVPAGVAAHASQRQRRAREGGDQSRARADLRGFFRDVHR